MPLIPASAAATVAYAAGTRGEAVSCAVPWGWAALGLALGFLGSAFFTILGHAVFALDSEEIETLERNHPEKARWVTAARKDVDRTWFTLLSGALFFNLVFAFSVGIIVWRTLGAAGFLAGASAVVAAIAVVLPLGEGMPGLLAARWLNSLAPFAARCSLVLVPVLAPFSAPPLFLLRVCSRLLRLDTEERARAVEVEKRLLALIGLGQVDVSLEEEEREMIDHALEFGESRARDIMTPRGKIAAIETSYSQAAVLQLLRESSCSRLLVYDKTLDHVVGVVHRKQALLNPETDYHEMVTTAVFVSENMELIEIMALMKRRHRQIVAVLDEYGATVGIVSMADLLQALVGPSAGEEETPRTEVPPKVAPAEEGETP